MPFQLEIEIGEGARLRGHDHFWAIIRALGQGGAAFTIADVVRETNAHEDVVGDFVRRLTRARPPVLEAAGWRTARNKAWAEGSATRARTYRLLRAPVETPSLRRDGAEGLYGRRRQAMWNIIRGPQAREGGLDARDLVLLAETDELPIALGTAKEYLRRLATAGYLSVVQKAAHNRLTRYRPRPSLCTGRARAPKLLRGSLVYDPNVRAVVGPIVCEEDRP